MAVHIEVDRNELQRLLEIEKLRHWEIAKKLGISMNTVQRRVNEWKLKSQRTGPREGPGHPEWRGGRILDKHGYVLLYRPDHHRARKMGTDRKRRYVLEHILVMEEKLGRPVLRGEVVHHVNGVNDDNRPENLMIFPSNGEHLRHELTGKCPKWSPEGRARILASVRQQRGSRKKSKPGAPPSPQS